MKQYSLITLAILMITGCQPSDSPLVLSDDAPKPLDTDEVSLFSGDDLGHFNRIGDADWRLVDDYVESSGAKQSYLVSKDRYRDFELHVEFWPSPDANSGIFVRCQDRTAIADETCYEINIYDQHPNPANVTGSIVNRATAREVVLTGGKWNSYDITIRGSHIMVKLNDTVVIDIEDESFADGPIGLQSNGGLIRFRNIRVRLLVPQG